jgi:hypothetical protein
MGYNAVWTCRLLLAAFRIGLLFHPKDVSDTIHQNVGGLRPNYPEESTFQECKQYAAHKKWVRKTELQLVMLTSSETSGYADIQLDFRLCWHPVRPGHADIQWDFTNIYALFYCLLSSNDLERISKDTVVV